MVELPLLNSNTYVMIKEKDYSWASRFTWRMNEDDEVVRDAEDENGNPVTIYLEDEVTKSPGCLNMYYVTPMTEQERAQDREEGKTAGRKWVLSAATPEQLRRLPVLANLMANDEHDIDSVLDGWVRSSMGIGGMLFLILNPSMYGVFREADAIAFWEEVLRGDDWNRIYEEDFARGFIEGALEENLVAKLPLINSHEFALIDGKEYPWASQYTWRIDEDGHVVRDAMDENGKPVTIYLCNELLSVAQRRLNFFWTNYRLKSAVFRGFLADFAV